MNYQTIETFYVVGISTRTTNENGQAAQDIEQLWQIFWNQNISAQIANKINDEIYAVYTNYESDHTKPYDTIIGYAVHSLENIPAGFVGLTIQQANYKKITSKGTMPAAVFNTWLSIWADDELSSKRAYQFDFTIHGEKYNDQDTAEVDTYISIK